MPDISGMILIASIIILAALANAMMDVLQFRWYRSIFPKSIFWTLWAGPKSWENKNMISNRRFFRWLFRGMLVWITDGWHFSQFIMFTSYQSGLIWLADLPDLGYWPWLQFLTYLAAAKILHGFIFELFYKQIFTA